MHVRCIYIFLEHLLCNYILFIAAYRIQFIACALHVRQKHESKRLNKNLTFSYAVRNQITFTTFTLNRWMTHFGHCLIIRYTELDTSRQFGSVNAVVWKCVTSATREMRTRFLPDELNVNKQSQHVNVNKWITFFFDATNLYCDCGHWISFTVAFLDSLWIYELLVHG